jgi:hypothetical protein
MVVVEEFVDLETPSGAMRTHIIRPAADPSEQAPTPANKFAGDPGCASRVGHSAIERALSERLE